MYAGKLVFSQIVDYLPTFRRCVQRYGGNRKVKRFSCLDQYLCMAFAPLTYRESLRDIEACLRAQQNKQYHMGIRGTVSRNTSQGIVEHEVRIDYIVAETTFERSYEDLIHGA